MGRKKPNGFDVKAIAKRNAEIINMLGKKTDLADKLGVTNQTLSNYSKGLSPTFSPEYLLRLYKLYNVNPMHIIAGVGDKFIDKKSTKEMHFKKFDKKLDAVLSGIESIKAALDHG